MKRSLNLNKSKKLNFQKLIQRTTSNNNLPYYLKNNLKLIQIKSSNKRKMPFISAIIFKNSNKKTPTI